MKKKEFSSTEINPVSHLYVLKEIDLLTEKLDKENEEKFADASYCTKSNLAITQKDVILAIKNLLEDRNINAETSEVLFTIISRLMRRRPLTQLTGEDKEWVEIFKRSSDEDVELKSLEYNVRYPAIHRYNCDNSKAFDTTPKYCTYDCGKTWSVYTNHGDTPYYPITFPYTVPAEPSLIYFKPDGTVDSEMTYKPWVIGDSVTNFEVL
jgi:hypothetical protein